MPADIRHHAKPEILRRARAMRKESAPAEQLLWSRLRAGRLNGYKFRRQQPIGRFVADFFCASCKLIVELDGDSHAERSAYDQARSEWLNPHGCRVIRFNNDDVYRFIDAVLEQILRECQAAC